MRGPQNLTCNKNNLNECLLLYNRPYFLTQFLWTALLWRSQNYGLVEVVYLWLFYMGLKAVIPILSISPL